MLVCVIRSMRLFSLVVSAARSHSFLTECSLRVRLQKVNVVVRSIVYDPPRTNRTIRPSLDGHDLQVPRNRERVHPGLAARPRTPGPHPIPGGFNETAFESNLVRGLLVVQIHWVLVCVFLTGV